MNDKAGASTPENVLRERLLNPNHSKSELEHYAARKIFALEAQLKQASLAPGQMRCAKCKLTVTQNILNMGDGTVSADSKTSTCPNGCGNLWPITWREYTDKLMESLDSLVDERNELTKANELLADELVCSLDALKEEVCDYEARVKEAEELATDLIKVIEFEFESRGTGVKSIHSAADKLKELINASPKEPKG